MGDQNLEKIEHFLPMRGVALRRQIVQTGEVEALAPSLIEKGGQFLSKTNRLIDMAFGLAGEYELRQQKLAAQRRHRRGQVAAVGQRGRAGLVFVDIAERADAWQQNRARARLAQKCLGQRAAGAAGGEQNRYPAKRQRIVIAGGDNAAIQHAVDQGIGERQFGRDGKNARRRGRCAHPPPSRDNRRPASANASGVPT